MNGVVGETGTNGVTATDAGARPARFGGRLVAAMEARGPLCVGIDPHRVLLDAWGLDDTAEGLRSFSLRALDAIAPHVAALKPQSAFFERHGSRGIAVLEDVLAAAREAGVLTILDVKRGDIGSTMAGYAEAYLADGAPLAADAITVSPFLGSGSLRPAVDLALSTGRGLFVLALTSNPEGREVQHARSAMAAAAATAPATEAADPAGPAGSAGTAGTAGTAEGTEPDAAGVSVAASIARTVAHWNAEERAAATSTSPAAGSFGLVVGATVGDAARSLGLDLGSLGGPLLAPGFGAQGAGRTELAELVALSRDAEPNVSRTNPHRPGASVLASTSRAVLGAGPGEQALADAARAAADEARLAADTLR